MGLDGLEEKTTWCVFFMRNLQKKKATDAFVCFLRAFSCGGSILATAQYFKEKDGRMAEFRRYFLLLGIAYFPEAKYFLFTIFPPRYLTCDCDMR